MARETKNKIMGRRFSLIELDHFWNSILLRQLDNACILGLRLRLRLGIVNRKYSVSS